MEVVTTDQFDRWLMKLRDTRAKASVVAWLNRVVASGKLVGDIKSVGGGVFERRFDIGPGYRVYFARRGNVIVVVLAAGDKGSQQRDIKNAKDLNSQIDILNIRKQAKGTDDEQ